MFKIGLILLAFIAMVGTTTHYAFANNMGGPSVQPLCSTDTGGGMNMAPNTSDQGSGGGGSSVGPSTPTTGPSAGSSSSSVGASPNTDNSNNGQPSYNTGPDITPDTDLLYHHYFHKKPFIPYGALPGDKPFIPYGALRGDSPEDRELYHQMHPHTHIWADPSWGMGSSGGWVHHFRHHQLEPMY